MSNALERFVDEHAAERDPERKAVLAAIIRLLRSEPLYAVGPGAPRRETLVALARESGIPRFQFASSDRGRHHALGRRYLEAVRDPNSSPAAEGRLRAENARLRELLDAATSDYEEARRTSEMLARAMRVLTAENERLKDDLARQQQGRLRAVPTS